MSTVLRYMSDHPELVLALAWPLLTSLLSFFDEQLKQRCPRLFDLLMSSGLDAKQVAKALLDLIITPK